MLTKFVLSTGEITGRIEKYIMDVFQMNLCIFEGDIPGSTFGFNFFLGDVKKDELLQKVQEKAYELCRKVASSFSGVRIELESVSLVDEGRAILSIRVNDERQNFKVNI